MRQFFMVMLVAVAAGLMPAMVRADNPNQEAAKQIRDHLHDSGQLVDYKIAVRYLNGTVWLQGHVRDQDQLNKAVALVFATQGVTINQVIRDELTIDGAKPGSPANPRRPRPLRRTMRQTRCVGTASQRQSGPGRCRRRSTRRMPPRPWR